MLTRQTVQGRANDGGLRIGEMERDGVIAHGAAYFLRQSMLERGDEYYMAVCNHSGMIAIYNPAQNLFMSPMADGPIQFADTLTSADNQALNIQKLTRFGRSFSVVRVPYAFKLLMQELQAMNVQMRVLTEDNIDQIASMSFSTTMLTLGGPANLIRENKVAVGSRMPKLHGSPKDDNRPALRPTKEGEEEEEPGAEKAESLGWHFVNFEANGGEIYQSLLRDEKGVPTQMWSVQQHGGKYPNEHPAGWNAQMLYYNDGVPIKAAAVIDLLKQMPYANNFALAVQDIRDEQAMSEADQKDADAIPLSFTPMSPEYTSMHESTSHEPMMQQQPVVQSGQMQQPMMVPQPMMIPQSMMVPQTMMMMPQQQPMFMVPQQQSMVMVPQPQPQPPTSATGANAAQLIEEQLHSTPNSTPTTSESSMLDVAPVKPTETTESTDSSSSSSSTSSEGKRVIKLS